MKKHILLLTNLLICFLSVAQSNFDYSNLVGTYEGLIYEPSTMQTRNEVELKVELYSDFTLSYRINPKGSSSKMNSIKLAPQDAVNDDKGLKCSFKILDNGYNNQTLEFRIVSPDAMRQGVLISLPFDGKRSVYFLMNREGGNPRYYE